MTSWPYFQLPPGSYLIVFPDSGLPFTPGHNFISFQSTGPAATYTMTASYETPSFNTLTLAEPLAYLREAQNGDGGWGLQRGQLSEFYTSLHVLLTLVQWLHYDFETEYADGIAYLKSQQLGDGSFGYAGRPIPYVTALAALNLVRSETYPFSAETEDAITALLAMQDVDDSWDQEPYGTALAVLTLWGHNQGPTADAGSDQNVNDAGEDCLEDIALDGTGSDDIDGSIESYVWTEDDLEIATGPWPTVTFAVGTHALELTVTDDDGKTDTDTLTVTIVGTGSPSDTCHCCLDGGACFDGDPANCLDQGGSPAPGACVETEACCLGDDTCQNLDPACCVKEGGIPSGPGSNCSGLQACCLPGGGCAELDPNCCDDLGGAPQGPSSTCSVPVACCLPNDTCEDLEPLCCLEQGGTPQDPGTSCAADSDGDGVPDACDPCPLDNPDDTDGDGVCDSDDICVGDDRTGDSDGDGFCDDVDLCLGDDASGDVDADGVCADIDNCELFNPDQTDCQPNDVGDVCDIANETSSDDNDNGIPDECEGPQCGDCPTDVDDNGQTGAFDLAFLLGNWGPVTPDSVCLDADKDGIIGAFDLAVLLGAWGPCE